MIVLIILALLFLFPLYWIVTGAFKTGAEINATSPVWIPSEWDLGNFERLMVKRSAPLFNITIPALKITAFGYTVRLGSGTDATDAVLTLGEQVNGEEYYEGQILKVYLVEVRRGSRGPQMLISRTHPGLVKRLFELEVPEIFDGTVEIRSIAREAGSRTKMAVWSSDPDVDPIGACVGPKGQRVGNIVEELRGEKIDIVPYSEDPAEFVAAALAPADVISVQLAEEGKACRAIVPDDQLSLAIGKEGQNARLAARLTGYKIDIKPASYHEEA